MGLASCPLDSPSSVIRILRILTGQADILLVSTADFDREMHTIKETARKHYTSCTIYTMMEQHRNGN